MRALYLAGATGTGKSGVALELARHTGAEIVNADAFQVYRGLDILSAKPSAAEQQLVPHHLFSIIPASQSFNAAAFAERARPCIAEILRRGKVPLVVGGTGLYIKALTHGLSPLPAADPGLRTALSSLPSTDLVSWLQAVDPQGAASTNLENPRYVQRALEITLQSGLPMSTVKNEWTPGFTRETGSIRGVLLQREREDLYSRINARVVSMIEEGLLDEVRDAGELSATAEKAIGIRDVRRHLAGEITLEECISAIQQATRRFAKRQLTWFNREKEFQSICLTPEDDAKSACARVMELVAEWE